MWGLKEKSKYLFAVVYIVTLLFVQRPIIQCDDGESSMFGGSTNTSNVDNVVDDSNDSDTEVTLLPNKLADVAPTKPAVKAAKASDGVTEFSNVVRTAKQILESDLAKRTKSNKTKQTPVKFNLSNWTKRTTGGLWDPDRILLAKVYGKANSVFEYGLGESTYIADHVGVKRYAGIDSDPVWVADTREKVASHFRFYFADVGKTKRWGYPSDETLAKNVFNYQLQPLIAESQPFDVYMVDGRWRVGCVLASLLHASDRGAKPQDTTILLHDCKTPPRANYKRIEQILDRIEHSGGLLCVYKRKKTTTDAQIRKMWDDLYSDVD